MYWIFTDRDTHVNVTKITRILHPGLYVPTRLDDQNTLMGINKIGLTNLVVRYHQSRVG